MGQAKSTFIGITGTVRLSALIREGARLVARSDFARCLAEEFSGEEVRDILVPSWMGELDLVLPVAELRSHGLEPDLSRAHLYATCTVGEHIDDMDGLSVAVVLHSDGFAFRQCGFEARLRAGDWFVFDDREVHEVVEQRDATTLLVLTAPLNPC